MKKKGLRRICKAIISSYEYGSMVDEEDYAWLTKYILRYHPDWPSYVAKHPDGISIEWERKGGSSGQIVMRVWFKDGTSEPISWTEAVSAVPFKAALVTPVHIFTEEEMLFW